DSWRNAFIEPVGFFFDRVSEPGNPDKTIELSLVEVRRTGNGGLEYRGVGRRPRLNASLDYWWRARDAWGVRSSTNGLHKLIFRTLPTDLKQYNEDGTESHRVIHNIGVIEFSTLSSGRPEQLKGIFFDFTENREHLKSGRVELSPLNDLIPKEAS